MESKAAARNRKRHEKKQAQKAAEAAAEGQANAFAQGSTAQETSASAGLQELSIEPNVAGGAHAIGPGHQALAPAVPYLPPPHLPPQTSGSLYQYSSFAQGSAIPPQAPSNNPTPSAPQNTKHAQDYRATPDGAGENLELSLAELQIGLNPGNVMISQNRLCANYFPIKVNIDIIFQYSLAIVRMDDNDRGINRNQKKRLVHILMQKLVNANNQIAMATNYHDQILSVSGDLKAENFEIPGEVTIDYYDEYQTGPPSNPSRFQITISKPKALSYDSLFRDLSLNQALHAEYPDKEDAINALNIIFSYGPYQASFAKNPTTTPNTNVPSLTTVGGHRFYGVFQSQHPRETATGAILNKQNETPGRNSILGFSRSVRSHKGLKGSLNLNINTATAMFYPQGTVSDLITRWTASKPPAFRTDRHVASFIAGLTIRTMYHSNNQNYLTSICGIPQGPGVALDDNRRMRTPGYTGSQTVREYFSSTHSKARSGPGVRVVLIGNPRDPSIAPADLLWVLPGQMYRDPLEKPVGAIRGPLDNRGRILARGPSLFHGGPGSQGAGEFQLELSNEMLQVPVKSLKVPMIQYGLGGGTQNPYKPMGLALGNWNLQKCVFSKTPSQPCKWTCFALVQSQNQSEVTDVDAFVSNFGAALKKYGLSTLRHEHLPSGTTNTSPSCHRYRGQAQDLCDDLKVVFSKINAGGFRMVVLLLPKKDPELYGAIKQICDIFVGVVSICHVMDRFQGSLRPKLDDNFFANLCMKANLKLADSAHSTVNQHLSTAPDILSRPCMIMGIDVTHPGPLSYHRAPSVAAVVGSVDGFFAQFPASLRANYPRVENDKKNKEAMEEVVPLRTMVLERLRDFRQRNPQHPLQRLIIYRDGLSESQFRMCQERELASINAALDEFNQENRDTKPKVLLICTVKRHQTRLFPIPGQTTINPILTRDRKEGGPKGGVPDNPIPGSWVSDRITYGEGNDFFLYSHQAIQGTARPTHYVVLHNEESYKLETIAEMTHQLCYLFGRATRSVSVCPAAYYADLACDRARHYVRRFYNAPKVDGPRETFDIARDGPEFERLLQPHESIRKTMFYI